MRTKNILRKFRWFLTPAALAVILTGGLSYYLNTGGLPVFDSLTGTLCNIPYSFPYSTAQQRTKTVTGSEEIVVAKKVILNSNAIVKVLVADELVNQLTQGELINIEKAYVFSSIYNQAPNTIGVGGTRCDSGDEVLTRPACRVMFDNIYLLRGRGYQTPADVSSRRGWRLNPRPWVSQALRDADLKKAYCAAQGRGSTPIPSPLSLSF